MATGYTSTVPAAITGLLAALRTSQDLAGVEIHDGPKVSESKAREAIAVGFTGEIMSRTGAYPEPSQPVAEITATLDEQLSVTPVSESYPIRCWAVVRNGAKNITAARTRAYELLSACGAAIAADKKLGGAVAMATMGDHILSQTQDQKGATASIVFEVNCKAWTGR